MNKRLMTVTDGIISLDHLKSAIIFRLLCFFFFFFGGGGEREGGGGGGGAFRREMKEGIELGKD